MSVVVACELLATVNLKGHDFHPEWDHTSSPTSNAKLNPPFAQLAAINRVMSRSVV